MMVFLNILALLGLSFVLIKSADSVIIAIRRLSIQTGTKQFALAAIVLAIGTSLPEMFVGITSALEGSPNIALGTVVGSNIANISLVAGIAAFTAGKIRVHGDFLKRDVFIALIAGVLPVLFLLDSTLSRVDGLILLSVYAAYTTSFFKKRYEEITREQRDEEHTKKIFRKLNHIDIRKGKELGRFFASVAVMLFAADAIVRLGTILAQRADIPDFIVGLVVVAIGTSLPELAFSFRSLKDREPSMFFGNLLGSTIANSTLIIGLVATIAPIHVQNSNQYGAAVLFFLFVYLIFWYFIKTKRNLVRWEAAILILLYIIFLVTEFVSL